MLAPAGRGIGLIRAVTHNIQKILKILLPIILPTARSTLFLRAAATEVTNSGSDVPIAMIVVEIRKSLNQKYSAIFTALSTVHVPPKYNPTNHPTINNAILG